jgi:16S rRNA (adenine1518-N6/adenine1519-N6)-dimethyltransferase
MNQADHDSPAAIRILLSELGIALKKRWGQNFLINAGARRKILLALGAEAGERIWEIGPGLGSMTGALLESGARVTAFEIDRGLCRYLVGVFGSIEDFILVEGDFLKTWEKALSDCPPDRILGNLPYSSASIMIAALAESPGLDVETMIFTVQKELGERIVALPGAKAYSAFSVLCQARFNAAGRGVLKPGSFFPVPEVESAIIELKPRKETGGEIDISILSSVTRMFFASRRKTIRNNIAAGELPGIPRELIFRAIADEGIDAARRAEELSPRDYMEISRRLGQLRGA